MENHQVTDAFEDEICVVVKTTGGSIHADEVRRAHPDGAPTDWGPPEGCRTQPSSAGSTGLRVAGRGR